MKICLIVSENGLGHFKRCVGLWEYWSRLVADIHCTIYCQEWQIRATNTWEKAYALRLPNCQLIYDRVSPGVTWSTTPGVYRDNRLISWIDKFMNDQWLVKADIIISDNLTGILSLRPDTVMMGSFLWMDVLRCYEYIPEVAVFLKQEYELIKTYKPPMLCVGAIAMPHVFEMTAAVSLPWFGQAPKMPRKPNRYPQTIAVTGGATDVADSELLEIASTILTQTTCKLMVPAKFYNKLSIFETDRLEIFGFEWQDFENADLVIGRPGIGLVTDCIVSGTPMLLFSENGNAEMEHNSRRLNEMGLAMTFNIAAGATGVINAINEIFEENIYTGITNNLQKQPVNGFEKAVDWLTKYGSNEKML